MSRIPFFKALQDLWAKTSRKGQIPSPLGKDVQNPLFQSPGRANPITFGQGLDVSFSEPLEGANPGLGHFCLELKLRSSRSDGVFSGPLPFQTYPCTASSCCPPTTFYLHFPVLTWKCESRCKSHQFRCKSHQFRCKSHQFRCKSHQFRCRGPQTKSQRCPESLFSKPCKTFGQRRPESLVSKAWNGKSHHLWAKTSRIPCFKALEGQIPSPLGKD